MQSRINLGRIKKRRENDVNGVECSFAFYIYSMFYFIIRLIYRVIFFFNDRISILKKFDTKYMNEIFFLQIKQ